VNTARPIALLLLGVELLAACGPAHIAPFTPRQRKYEEGEYAQNSRASQPSQGSIYTEATAGYLEDTRALRVGDVVRIQINEEADASGGASTQLKKESKREGKLEDLMGIVPALKKMYPDLDPSKLVALAASSDFSGEGKTERAGKLHGVIGVQVRKELPNGDLFVEGTKVVMINEEEYHLYVSGVIRPADIQRDNTIDSSLIADARVEYTGRGDVADQVKRGWFTWFLDKVNPF
jgi:flagellar L-ring protein precursor FlgH